MDFETFKEIYEPQTLTKQFDVLIENIQWFEGRRVDYLQAHSDYDKAYYAKEREEMGKRVDWLYEIVRTKIKDMEEKA